MVKRDVVWPSVAAATSSSDRIVLQRAVGGGGETSSRRGGHDKTAAAAPRATPDGPPTDSEHAECANGESFFSMRRGELQPLQN